MTDTNQAFVYIGRGRINLHLLRRHSHPCPEYRLTVMVFQPDYIDGESSNSLCYHLPQGYLVILGIIKP
jgi:hypothetical protein